MLAIRVWVIAAAAAFVASPLAHAQSHDCDRYPAVCEQPAEAKAVTEPTPRGSAPVKKRKARVAKRPEKSRADSQASRTPAQEQPASPALGGTTTVDAAVLLPQSLVDVAPAAAMAAPTESPALAAAGAWITLPTDDPRTGPGVELATVGQANAAGSTEAVRFVRSDEVNEIDLAAREPEPGASSWLRYLIATLGAALAAASMVRFLFV
jgi:hypothetical protein